MRFDTDIMYAENVPKLWTDTIEEHRRAVHDAALDAAAVLVAEHGLASVTMSKIAAATGIGRATLYKYFPDVEALLAAWHQRQITRHLAQLAEARDAAGPGQQLEAVLETYALIQQRQHQHHGTEFAALLHQGEHVTRAQHQLHAFLGGLIAEAAEAGDIRDDTPPGELAGYCLYALTAAGGLPSEDAARRLVTVTLAGLRPAKT
jgi:AcrR family transcriptional regulator